MPNRKASLVAIGLIAATVAAIFIAMRVADVGVFSASKQTTTTTTAIVTATSSAGEHTTVATTTTVQHTAVATTTATPIVKKQAFDPANETESRAYFVSLSSSIKAARAEIKAQEAAVKNDPSVSNQTTLVGLKQNCMSVVTQYNTAAAVIASKAFRSAGLPPQVPPDECSP